MTEMRFDLALVRLLDALEAELLAAPEEEIRAAVADTGFSALPPKRRILAVHCQGILLLGCQSNGSGA